MRCTAKASAKAALRWARSQHLVQALQRLRRGRPGRSSTVACGPKARKKGEMPSSTSAAVTVSGSVVLRCVRTPATWASSFRLINGSAADGLGQQVRVDRVFVGAAAFEQLGRVGQHRHRRGQEMPGPGLQVRQGAGDRGRRGAAHRRSWGQGRPGLSAARGAGLSAAAAPWRALQRQHQPSRASTWPSSSVQAGVAAPPAAPRALAHAQPGVRRVVDRPHEGCPGRGDARAATRPGPSLPVAARCAW